MAVIGKLAKHNTFKASRFNHRGYAPTSRFPDILRASAILEIATTTTSRVSVYSLHVRDRRISARIINMCTAFILCMKWQHRAYSKSGAMSCIVKRYKALRNYGMTPTHTSSPRLNGLTMLCCCLRRRISISTL